MAGGAGTVPFVAHAEAMAQGKIPWNTRWLQHASKRCPGISLFPSLLARHHFQRCQYADSRDCLKEAIKRETDQKEREMLESELREVMVLGSGD